MPESHCHSPWLGPRAWRERGVPGKADSVEGQRSAPREAGRGHQLPSQTAPVLSLLGSAGHPSDPRSLHLLSSICNSAPEIVLSKRLAHQQQLYNQAALKARLINRGTTPSVRPVPRLARALQKQVQWSG